MTTNQQRIAEIKKRLVESLEPHLLVITDDSHHHQGHPGAQKGHGHFTVEIAAHEFENKSLTTCHRMIYKILGSLMETDIHALRIKIICP